jgi:hypothetical protein
LGGRAIVVSIVSVFNWQRGYRICAYAVMSNNTHVVVCVDKDMAESWSMEEVVRRWHMLYQGTLLSQKYQIGDKLSKGECISLKETVTIYRQRLYDISWLMRNLNEYIARVANKEDKRTGRFKSQACFYDKKGWKCSISLHGLCGLKSYPRQDGGHTWNLKTHQYSAPYSGSY